MLLHPNSYAFAKRPLRHQKRKAASRDGKLPVNLLFKWNIHNAESLAAQHSKDITYHDARHLQ